MQCPVGGEEMKSKKIAQLGLLTALALILSYLESLVPAFFAVPGMKLGLTNTVVLMALYRMDNRTALEINFVRIVLVSTLFGNTFSFLYALSGGMLSGLVMILLKRSSRFSMLSVSVAGGIFHNVGQILAAMVLLETWQVVSYLLVLWFSGIAAGAVIGLLSGEILKRLPENVLVQSV